MVKIYCIEDINDLRYIGSTSQKYLSRRMSGHKRDKKIGHYCSSSKLNLDNSIIYQLEECSEDLRQEREKYWINKLGIVNYRKLNGQTKENKRKYYHENKEEINRKRRKKYKLLKLSDQKNNL